MPFRRLFRVFVLLMVVACAASPVRAQSKDAEQALRARVEQYYTFVQTAQWDKAENFVSEDSRAVYRAGPKSPVMGSEYQSASIAQDGKSAVVRVKIQAFSPMGGAQATIMQTQWKLVRGSWYLYVEKPLAAPNASGVASVKTPPPDIKFDAELLNLGLIPDAVIERRIGFTNISDHPITVESINSDSDLLKLSVTKKTLKPQEKAELVVQFNAVGYWGEFGQTILVKTSPGSRLARINISASVAASVKAKDKETERR